MPAESGVILSMLRKSWRRRAFPRQGEEQTHWMHSQKADMELAMLAIACGTLGQSFTSLSLSFFI